MVWRALFAQRVLKLSCWAGTLVARSRAPRKRRWFNEHEEATSRNGALAKVGKVTEVQLADATRYECENGFVFESYDSKTFSCSRRQYDHGYCCEECRDAHSIPTDSLRSNSPRPY